MKKQVLFVDDEPNLLDGLKRSLRSQRREWDMVFAMSGPEALELAQQQSFDAVVSDMRMPGMDGAQMLDQMSHIQPETVRIVLSGHSDEKLIMKSVGPAHQYLSKPCDVDVLKGTLSRTFLLQELFTGERLHALVAGLETLPSLPEIYIQLTRLLESEDASINGAAKLISQDPSMTAKLLKMVNSAFFGIGRRISNPLEATTLLGMDTLKALVLGIGIFSQFDGAAESGSGRSLDHIWRHSMVTSRLARAIAKREQLDKASMEDTLVAGLVHDIGKVIILTNLAEEWKQISALRQQSDIGQCEAENEILGTSHTTLGAYLLGLWGLPDSVVEAVAFHHDPATSMHQKFTPLVAVHIADALLHDDGRLDMAYLEKLGLTDHLDDWKALVAESAQEN